mgnify:CR=1 FL=1|jgi:putative nucleotidyltransferase with HDIG domain
MTIKNQPFPIWRTIQISMLALLVWVFGLMAFMPAFISHSARLVMLIVLIAVLIIVARLTRQVAYRGYIFAIVASAIGISAYYLIYPIMGHGEWVFALIVIAVTSQWGLLPGLTAALLSAIEYGFISYYQTGAITDVFILAGLFAVSAAIIGTLVKHREAALVARTHIADELAKTSESTLIALTRALDARDQDTEGHSERVAALAVVVGKEMGLKEPELQSLRLAALLHDIGKIGIPDAVLHKTGALDEQDWKYIRKHPRMGYEILHNIPFLGSALDAVLHHHEKFNGEGYPDGLQGELISLPARILAVVDVYDALTSHRPYRAAYSPKKATEMLLDESGQHFDPKVAQIFIRILADERQTTPITEDVHLSEQIPYE